MPQRQVKRPPILDETSISADASSQSIFPRGKNGFSLTYEWCVIGNLVAVLYLQCRNDSRDTFVNCNNATFPSQPNGSEGRDEYAVVDTVHKEYRVFVDVTSGDGSLTIRCNLGEEKCRVYLNH